jgi:hypothetical protein
MNESRLGALYRRVVASRVPHDRAGCPSPEEVEALADGSLPDARRLALVDHVAACADCARDLALLHSVTAARPPAPNRHIALAVAAAAAAIIVLAVGAPLLWRALSPVRYGDVLRGSDRRLALVAPDGMVTAEEARVLRWRRAERAGEYRVELMRGGALSFGATTGDTTLTLPDSVRLDPGADYEWIVEARVDGERVSAVGRFRIR